MKKKSSRVCRLNSVSGFMPVILLLLGFLLVMSLHAENKTDDQLIDKLIESSGYSNIIAFDSTNIKQFWIDPSVISSNNHINIQLIRNVNDRKESIPFKLQLANVVPSLLCRVDVISEENDFVFRVSNSKSEPLSNSESNQSFLNYHINSLAFPMENALDSSFFITFSSDKVSSISLKKIILSFSNNPNTSFVFSPGSLNFTKKTAQTNDATILDGEDFLVKGIKSYIFSAKKLVISEEKVNVSAKVKNVGDASITLYLGFEIYSPKGEMLLSRNYPYENNNQILSVLSAAVGSKSIIINSYPKWKSKCYLALDPQDDLSDVPNTTLLANRILEIKHLENGSAEIVLETPLKTELKEGTRLRVHGQNNGNLYIYSKKLLPGDEISITKTIAKDKDYLQFSSEAFSRGVYYIVPLLYSLSSDSKTENTIKIMDFSVSY